MKKIVKKWMLYVSRNISNVGLWKCGKGKAFTHIPTNLIILIKKKDFGIVKNMRA